MSNNNENEKDDIKIEEIPNESYKFTEMSSLKEETTKNINVEEPEENINLNEISDETMKKYISN